MTKPAGKDVVVRLPRSDGYNAETANVLWLLHDAVGKMGLSCGFFIPQEGEALRCVISPRRH